MNPGTTATWDAMLQPQFTQADRRWSNTAPSRNKQRKGEDALKKEKGLSETDDSDSIDAIRRLLESKRGANKKYTCTI